MEMQQQIDFERVARAIAFIKEGYREQPGLDEVAAHVNMSPHHFQKMFTHWAGVSPKKFLQYISASHAKELLRGQRLNLEEASHAIGLSGSSRLHDLFINIEGMTPAEYKNGGARLEINYEFAETPFGTVLVASTHKGICHLSFSVDERSSMAELTAHFPNAERTRRSDALQQKALSIFSEDWAHLDSVKLHLRGTDFQIKVWESLLKVPLGALTSYGDLAADIGMPGASRAVGSALRVNPVAYLIPCHRVIRAEGEFGQYRWGPNRKVAIIGWEAGRVA